MFGTRGSAHAGVLNQGDLRVVTFAGIREEKHPPHPNRHQPLVEDFVAAVREGREPAVRLPQPLLPRLTPGDAARSS